MELRHSLPRLMILSKHLKQNLQTLLGIFYIFFGDFV